MWLLIFIFLYYFLFLPFFFFYLLHLSFPPPVFFFPLLRARRGRGEAGKNTKKKIWGKGGTGAGSVCEGRGSDSQKTAAFHQTY